MAAGSAVGYSGGLVLGDRGGENALLRQPAYFEFRRALTDVAASGHALAELAEEQRPYFGQHSPRCIAIWERGVSAMAGSRHGY